MRRTDVGCRQHIPPTPIPERGQVSLNVSHSPNQETRHVLHEDVSGFQTANGSDKLGPEPSLVVLTASSSSDADGLAREPASEEIDWLDSAPLDGGNVAVSRDVGPVMGKDVLAERVPLDLPSALPSGSLEAEVDAANSGEQAPEGRHFTGAPAAAASFAPTAGVGTAGPGGTGPASRNRPSR